jgi:hypothetical protein
LLHFGALYTQLVQRHSILVPQPLNKPHQLLSLLVHSSVESDLHILGEEFEYEGALLVFTESTTTVLEFTHKGAGEFAVASASFSQLFLYVLVGSKRSFECSELVEDVFERFVVLAERAEGLVED